MIASTHKSQGYWVGNFFKQVGYRAGHSDRTLTLVGSLGALTNGLSKVLFASALDYWPFKPIYGSLLLLMVISLLLMSLASV